MLRAATAICFRRREFIPRLGGATAAWSVAIVHLAILLLSFTPGPAGAAVLSESPTIVAPGATIVATWSGIAPATPVDWIGLYPQGAQDEHTFEQTSWIYVSSCTKTPGAVGKASGTCSYILPGNLSPAVYELHLLANDGYTRLASSNPFTVTSQVIIHVDTTQQGITNGQCSLQEAIYASELKSSMAIDATNPDNFYSTGCAAGTGEGDFIVLPPGAVFTFNRSWDRDAHNFFGPTATPVIFSTITIEGNGATLQWVDPPAGPGNSRLFTVAKVKDPNFSGTGHLTLKNVYIKGFHVKGGDGGKGGGGGGLGAGGAIYVFEGSLTVENSTFENNGAVGGNGGFGTAGGGGGLSGNGGEGCSNSGGGGGGSRGNGGKGGDCPPGLFQRGGGGGGGGRVSSGGDGTSTGSGGIGGSGGFRCGGQGGEAGREGQQPTCEGAGGGGGGGIDITPCGIIGFYFGFCNGDGAEGSYGGGGGGGKGDGGHGGFGGGGGGGDTGFFSASGGDGGFGGGGGAVSCTAPCFWGSYPGKGGRFGGHADSFNGGGGGALGGAIFNHNGTVRVENSTFVNNFVTRGVGGGGSASNGADAGGAIFSLNNSLYIAYSTFSGNQSTGSGGAIVVYAGGGPGSGAPVSFSLFNTIIAKNGANECFFNGSVLVEGAGNLIMNNGSGTAPFSPCPPPATKDDPQLLPLQLNSPGNTPTMAIFPTSPAANNADAGTFLPFDQRGVGRPQRGGLDIGAFEARGDGT